MQVVITVRIETEALDDEELSDMADAVVDTCKEWGHEAEAIARIS